MNPCKLYELVALTRHPCSLEHPARREADQTWICPGCGSPKPGTLSVNAWIQDRTPRGRPLNIMWDGGIGLVHTSLIECIGPAVAQRDLYLGKVIGTCGDELKDWFTFRGRRSVIVRGTKKCGFRVCDVCRQTLYSSMGKKYLFPAPPEDATIFEARPGGLIVPDDICQRVSARKWGSIGIVELPVLDEPLDGLGVLPQGPG